MTSDLLLYLFNFNHAAITRNCDGLSHEESLVPPKPAGNPLNWVLGHILANRTYVLKLLGEAPLWSEADEAPYERGKDGLDPASARRFEDLLRDLDTTQEKIRAGIARLTPEALAEPPATEEKRTRAQRLYFMQFHEAYHAGQLGLLRRMAGKSGAI